MRAIFTLYYHLRVFFTLSIVINYGARYYSTNEDSDDREWVRQPLAALENCDQCWLRTGQEMEGTRWRNRRNQISEEKEVTESALACSYN